jgi:SAM-dependent methyltransferase
MSWEETPVNAQAMEPFGMALLAYFEGCANAELIVRRDDGKEALLPVSLFFREQSDFTAIEKAAIELCKGHVLDVGAGTGLHSMALHRRGLPVTPIDINPQAVTIMRQRGLKDAHCADIFKFQDGHFDTLLMMGHGIGMVETIAGLEQFLGHAHTLLSGNGQLVLDSLDVRITDDPGNLAYHEANRKAGRYIGEIRMQFEFRGQRGPFCGWLQVDAETLTEHAKLAGWLCETVHREQDGDYLGQLTRQKTQ